MAARSVAGIAFAGPLREAREREQGMRSVGKQRRAAEAVRTRRNGTDRRSRDALVWLDPPVRIAASRLRVVAYDAGLPVPDWLTEALAASRRNAEPGLPL
jgi:hypothetical protein